MNATSIGAAVKQVPARTGPILIRILIAGIIWGVAFFPSGIRHMCGLGFKTAEHMAPYVVASLASLSVFVFRRYLIGMPAAAAIVALYVRVVFPAYSAWIHGPYAPHFPNASSASRIREELRQLEAKEAEQTTGGHFSEMPTSAR